MTTTNNATNTGNPITVAQGGSGVATMTTAYAPVCAGTTATGALQVASTGLSTSGYVLTSNGSAALPSFQAVGSSHILQYVTTNLTTVFTSTAGTYATITGLSATITPSSSSSVIIIFAMVNLGANTGTINDMMIQLIRGSTPICVGGTVSSHGVATAGGNYRNNNDMKTFTIAGYVDSPSTTSATTYAIQAQPDTGTAQWNCNSTYADPNSQLGFRTASTITLMEWK